jgi:hypothetical protein
MKIPFLRPLRFFFLAAATAVVCDARTAGAAGHRESAAFGRRELFALLDRSPVTGSPVRTLEELLPLLPAALRENYTLVYDSRSPFRDEITPLSPRVILFTPDTRLVLSFTGDPAGRGRDLLEAISFDDATARFTGHKITLSRTGARPSHGDARECAACHGADFRPITDSYPVWPGFYGSVRDTFAPDSRELVHYREFLATRAGTGVYRFLRPPSGTPVPPYLDPEKHDRAALVGNLDFFKYLPNTRLGMGLGELNRKRIFRKLKAAPGYEAGKYRALSRLLGCEAEGVDADLPSSAVETMDRELLAENRARLGRLGLPPDEKLAPGESMQELQFSRALAEMSEVARALGTDLGDWSMALERGSLSFFDGILSGIHRGKSYYLKEDLILEILRDVAARDPRVRPYFKSRHIYEEYGQPFGERLSIRKALRGCGEIRRRARQGQKPPSGMMSENG